MPESPVRARLRRALARGVALATTAAALAGASLALSPAASAAPPETGAVTVTAPASVTAGDPVEVTVAIDGAVDLFAYDLEIAYDPALLSFTSGAGDFPDGGFDTVTPGTGTIGFVHSRLGSSPGLAGAQTLVTFTFTALAAGEAEIELASATFVSSTGETAALGEPVGTSSTIAAAPVAEPEPSDPPVDGAGGDGTAGSGTGTTASTNGTALAVTGLTGAWTFAAVLAAGLLALGTVLALRHRAVRR